MQKKNNLSQTIQRPRSQNMVRPTKKKINDLKNELTQYLDSNGYLSYSAKKRKYIILGTNSPKDGIVECPQCSIGQLMIIRSPITKKRFIGCSNYNNGCKASSPLLQRARLRATKTKCEFCKWPIVVFRYNRKQKWSKQCSNFKCKSRKTKV
jgi:ssDNA-binding Zn-finger/Zn-ribbon topoisomerase 1|tara:strand:- start:801 stop:1256 length:456 start_codon:yes stop_codon:yes gene_type:complete